MSSIADMNKLPRIATCALRKCCTFNVGAALSSVLFCVVFVIADNSLLVLDELSAWEVPEESLLRAFVDLNPAPFLPFLRKATTTLGEFVVFSHGKLQ